MHHNTFITKAIHALYDSGVIHRPSFFKKSNNLETRLVHTTTNCVIHCDRCEGTGYRKLSNGQRSGTSKCSSCEGEGRVVQTTQSVKVLDSKIVVSTRILSEVPEEDYFASKDTWIPVRVDRTSNYTEKNHPHLKDLRYEAYDKELETLVVIDNLSIEHDESINDDPF